MKTSILVAFFSIIFLFAGSQTMAITVNPIHVHSQSLLVKADNSFHKVLDDPKPKSQTTAFILALLGLFFIPAGWQRYYLGYKKQGIIMTVLALTVIGWPVAWVWTLIDFIKILDGSLKPADGSDYTDTL